MALIESIASAVGECNQIAASEPSEKQDTSSQVSNYKYDQALNEIEGVLIEFIEPKVNKQSGRLIDATEYFQVRREKGKSRDYFGEPIEKLEKEIRALSKKTK